MAINKGNCNSRGRPYARMLILAFGAAMLGVMLLHKLRERRVFNLLVQDKDRQIMSLKLLLQKERDSTKEVKRKNEEMKAKLYSLRAQRIELSNRISEMQSITHSLEEEYRTLELAIEEKQNEIKTLRAKETDSTKENTQVIALIELLKKKEAEIEEMKHHLDNNAHIWSVSIDDPSSPPINLTTRNIVGEDQNEIGETKLDGVIAEEGQHQESMNTKDDQNSTRYDHQSDNGKNSTFEAEIPREEQLQKLENNGDGESSKQIGDKSTDESQVNGETARDRKSNNPEDFQHGEFLGASNRSMNNINAMNGVGNSNDSQVFETKDEYGDSKAMDSKKHGSIKLEKLNYPLNGEGSRARVTHGFRRKMKAKRWRMTSEERGLKKYEDLEDGKGAKLKGRSFTKVVAKIDKQMLLLREGNLQKLVSHQYYKGLNMREAHKIHQDGNDDIILHENVKLLKPQTFLYGEGLIRNVNGEASGGTTNALEQAEDHAVERQIDIRAETKGLMEMKSQKIYEAALAHEQEIADTKSDASSDICR